MAVEHPIVTQQMISKLNSHKIADAVCSFLDESAEKLGAMRPSYIKKLPSTGGLASGLLQKAVVSLVHIMLEEKSSRLYRST